MAGSMFLDYVGKRRRSNLIVEEAVRAAEDFFPLVEGILDPVESYRIWALYNAHSEKDEQELAAKIKRQFAEWYADGSIVVKIKPATAEIRSALGALPFSTITVETPNNIWRLVAEIELPGSICNQAFYCGDRLICWPA